MDHVPPQGGQLDVVPLRHSSEEVELLKGVDKGLVGRLVHELKVENV